MSPQWMINSTPRAANSASALITVSTRPWLSLRMPIFIQATYGCRLQERLSKIVVDDQLGDQPGPDAIERDLGFRGPDGQYDDARPGAVVDRRLCATADVVEPYAGPPLVDAADDRVPRRARH